MDNPIMQVIRDAEMNMHSSNDDYEKDGLIYCGKCNTPKQVYIEQFKRAMPTPCQCRKEQIKEEEELREKINKQSRIKKLRDASLLGERYRDASFENTETSHSAEFRVIYDRCKRYCEIADEVDGVGIFLFGTNGTGKSRLTACMGNELMKNYYTVLYTNFAEISRQMFKSDEFIKQLSKIDFLFIDDFGTERVTKGNDDLWLQEAVFDVINKRYIDRKPIIFTSNYSLKELIEDRGIAKRSVDRIMEMCECMRLDGQSYRITAMKQRERLF
jgi:DNA replication protein DnaC